MVDRVVLASNNPGKIREIQEIFDRFRIVPQAGLGVPEAEESGATFVENAIIKARNAARYTGLPAIADDSGIEVDALGGAPGVRSARFAGPEADDLQNLQKLLAQMEAFAEDLRGARFRCAIVFMRHAEDDSPLIAEGAWEGRILREPRGSNGFGYDPIFWVPELGCASAELSPQVKNRISHRANALKKLAELLQQKSA